MMGDDAPMRSGIAAKVRADVDWPVLVAVCRARRLGRRNRSVGRIVFGRDESDLYTVNPDGTGLQLLMEDAIMATWSPDGTEISRLSTDRRFGAQHRSATDATQQRVGFVGYRRERTAFGIGGSDAHSGSR